MGIYGAVSNKNKLYTETLVVDNSSNQVRKFEDQAVAMIVDSDLNKKNNYPKLFTYEQQYKLFEAALEEFGGEGGMDFSSLEHYFRYNRSK